MNYLVRKILGKYFTSDQWANFIVKETAELAGKVFNDNHFQKMAKIKELDQEEQDRIFNEVQVSGLVYCIIFIEQRRQYLNENRSVLWRDVIEKIPKTFCGWLSELGVEKEYVNIWEKLIDLRLREYQEGIFEMKNVLKKKLDDDPRENIKEIFYSLESVAIGGMLHITRGKAEPDNPLKRHMMTWLGVLQENLAKKVN